MYLSKHLEIKCLLGDSLWFIIMENKCKMPKSPQGFEEEFLRFNGNKR